MFCNKLLNFADTIVMQVASFAEPYPSDAEPRSGAVP